MKRTQGQGAILGIVALGLLAACTTRPVSRSPEIPAHAVVGVQPEKLRADFWIARQSNARKVVLPSRAIAEQNGRLLKLDPSVHDIEHFSSSLAGADVKAWIGDLSRYPDEDMYGADGRKLERADFDALMQNAALDSVPALVFFNACESGRLRATVNPLRQLDRSVGFAEAFLRGGVANFIGTWWPVSDSAAAAFAAALYHDLAKGASIGGALGAARAAVRALPSADWANYLHYGSYDFTLKAPKG